MYTYRIHNRQKDNPKKHVMYSLELDITIFSIGFFGSHRYQNTLRIPNFSDSELRFDQEHPRMEGESMTFRVRGRLNEKQQQQQQQQQQRDNFG